MTATQDLAQLLRKTEAQVPVFAEPWQAQAFAITLKLYQEGCFSWREWTDCLSEQIAAATERGDPDTGENYYEHWLLALESIIRRKNLLLDAEVEQRKQAWDSAVRTTPHGQPIELSEAVKLGI